jgi:multiple sugar transport system substrate-binding protein
MLPRYFCACLALGSLAAFLVGCGPNSSTTSGGNKRLVPQLTVLVVDDSALGDTIKSEWRSRTEEEVIVRKITWKEAATAKRLPGDLIVYPAGHLGELAEAGLLAPISERTLENDAFALRDIYKQIRLREMKWGDQVLGMPLGSPQLLLVYRIDIFTKLGLKPPQTWADYESVAARLAKREDLGNFAPPADAPWRGAVEPLASGFAGQMLLARSAAYAANKEQISPLLELTTVQALIDRPPYVKALAEMKKVSGGEKVQQLTPIEAYQELAQGRCAMSIAWPSAATTALNKSVDAQAEFIGFAELPGASEVYDFGRKKWGTRGAGEEPHVPLLAISGRMVSVTATSSHQEAAENMATWLAGSEVALQLSPSSTDTTLFRISQEPDAAKWLGDIGDQGRSQYVAAFRQTQDRPQFSQGIRLPGRREYLSALDQAVIEALQGKKTPEEALAAAAAAWDKITARRGLEAQRGALQRSLGQKVD